MARFSNICSIMVTIFLSFTVATISATEDTYLDECAKHIGSHCGKQVYDNLFHDKSITEKCCYKLVQTGQSCHNKLVTHYVQKNPKLNSSEVYAKSAKIFSKCDQVTKPADPKILGKCKEKLGSHCAKEVFGKLVHDKAITKHCCEKLVTMGYSCHINLVKDLMRTNSEVKKANVYEVLEKSKKIFHNCQNVKIL